MNTWNSAAFTDSSPEERCAFHFDAYDACANFAGYVNRHHDWPFFGPFFYGPPQPVYSPHTDFYEQPQLPHFPSDHEEEGDDEVGEDEKPEGELQARKIFIGGLPYAVDCDELKDYFSQWGKLMDAVVIKDPATNKSRGFGFVVYRTVAMLENAMKNRPHTLRGKVVDSKMAIARDQMTPAKQQPRTVNSPRPQGTKNSGRPSQSQYSDRATRQQYSRPKSNFSLREFLTNL